MTHDCTHTTAVLLGESPWPGDARVEAQVLGCPDCAALRAALVQVDEHAAALPVLEAPPALRASTLQAVLDEMTPAPSRRPWLVPLLGGLAAAAALVLAVLPSGPGPAAPSSLVERGSGERLPETALKIAVRTEAGIERHRTGHAYVPGDTLLFRAALDQPAAVALVRQEDGHTQLIDTWQLPAGDHELSVAGGALAWRIEPGEGSARFALLAAPSDRDPAAVTEIVPRAAGSSGTLCDAARTSGWACDAHMVEVAP